MNNSRIKHKIRKNDEVIVIAGRDKGKRGKVLRVVGDRFYVAGVQLVSKHVKANPKAGENGGVRIQEAPIHASNIALINPSTDRAGRVGYKEVDGVKRRFFKSNGELLEN